MTATPMAITLSTSTANPGVDENGIVQQTVPAKEHGQLGVDLGQPLPATGQHLGSRRQRPAAPVKISRRSWSMARMRSLTEPYIVSRPPDRIAAVVMSTTGATIAWTAVTAIGFISPAYESSLGGAGPLIKGQQQPMQQSGSVSPSGPIRYAR